jgi:hypothetical protein
MSPLKPARLVEGKDYYVEGGKFVFTAAYHLKRGYCCNSKCRHCPYGADGGLAARIEFAGLSVAMGPQAAPNPRPAAPALKRMPGVKRSAGGD